MDKKIKGHSSKILKGRKIKKYKNFTLYAVYDKNKFLYYETF